jgi:hypothetical protein
MFGRNDGEAEGSLVFGIEQALDRVREGRLDDQAVALAANKIVRRYLDKHAISYADYRVWRDINPLIFTSVIDDQNRLIGFFDIFPLTSEAGRAIIAGKLTERTLDARHIIPAEKVQDAAYIHIASILVNPRQRTFSRVVAKEVVLLKMREFIERNYDPVEKKTYTAFAQSTLGEALLRRCGFSIAVLANENEQHAPLYVLKPDNTDAAIFRFDRVASHFLRRARTDDWDMRIEAVELRLRGLIAAALNDDPSNLPSHVQQKADERISAIAKRNAAFYASDYQTLARKLEFCDLREIEDTITNKSLWPKFRDRFVNKEYLASKFNQLAELRNGIRHSRVLDQITQMEGEAGVIWFERVLRK